VESSVNVLSILENGLFALGQVLRFPVMVLLWVCVASALFMAGHCLVDLVARQRDRRGFDLKAWLKNGRVLDTDAARLKALPAPLRMLIGDVENAWRTGSLQDGGLEHLVLEHEERIRHGLFPSRMLVKVGPSLGLLGTLIPMGTSLASLATGNLEAMAGQMVVAFTTTIIGLATGTLAYVVAAARQTWVTELVREQRFLAERIAVELGPDALGSSRAEPTANEALGHTTLGEQLTPRAV
jgi:biopolymer transport protein ExbB/TolQ